MQYRGVDTPNDVNETFYSTITVSAGMELSYNILGLMAHSAYNVSVRATNQYGVGDFSEEVTVRTGEGGECSIEMCQIRVLASASYSMCLCIGYIVC